MSLLTAFTTQVINFTTELTNMYPQDKYFKSTLTTALLMKKTNPRLMHNLIMENITEYRNEIFAENDGFFNDQITKLEESKAAENGETTSQDKMDIEQKQKDEENFNFVLRVRTYWNEMSLKTKKNIWMYLKVLFKLSDRM